MNPTALPLIIFKNDQVADMALCNGKAAGKSTENGELWIVDPHTERVLPYSGRDSDSVAIAGGVVPKPDANAPKWYEVTLASVEPGTPEDGASDRDAESAVAGGSDGERPQSDVDTSILPRLEALVRERRATMPEGSYTTHLFERGVEKIRKKTGEEAVELILARERDEMVGEAADLIYHLIVLLVASDLSVGDVMQKLRERH